MLSKKVINESLSSMQTSASSSEILNARFSNPLIPKHQLGLGVLVTLPIFCYLYLRWHKCNSSHCLELRCLVSSVLNVHVFPTRSLSPNIVGRIISPMMDAHAFNKLYIDLKPILYVGTCNYRMQPIQKAFRTRQNAQNSYHLH